MGELFFIRDFHKNSTYLYSLLINCTILYLIPGKGRKQWYFYGLLAFLYMHYTFIHFWHYVKNNKVLLYCRLLVTCPLIYREENVIHSCSSKVDI